MNECFVEQVPKSCAFHASIPLTLGPEDGPCQAFPWMLSIGFSLTFSAL